MLGAIGRVHAAGSVTALFVLSLFAGSASAEFWVQQSGPAVSTGSWSVPLTVTLTGVERFAARVTVGDVFEDPALNNLNQSGWSQTAISGDVMLALAEGPTTASALSLSLNFLADKPTVDGAVKIDVAAFAGGTWAMAHGEWVNSGVGPLATGGFDLGPGTWDPTADLAAIPAPGAALLGVIGLVALAFSRRIV